LQARRIVGLDPKPSGITPDHIMSECLKLARTKSTEAGIHTRNTPAAAPYCF